MPDDEDKPSQESLEHLRRQIDELDKKIQTLIGERVSVAAQIAELKKAEGATHFYRPEREAQVLRRIRDRNEGPLDDAEITRLMREIMSASMAAEEVMTIAYLGPEGTYAHAATSRHFGRSVKTLPLPTIDDVFASVSAERANYGIVPVENSTEGFVSSTLDQFLSSPLTICGEVQLRIQHHLLSLAAGLSEIQRVYSHAQSLGQCRTWLQNTLPGVALEAVESNAKAAMLAAEDERAAAIASAHAGEIYELESLASGIEDQPDNTTRFLVIGKESVPPSGEDKTSIVVSTRNETGALHRLLAPLAEHGVSMSRIESRPSGQVLWEYFFFMDLVGHVEDPPVAEVIRILRNDAVYFRLLGSYPAAVL